MHMQSSPVQFVEHKIKKRKKLFCIRGGKVIARAVHVVRCDAGIFERLDTCRYTRP